jgi:hypothetical protein
MRIFEQESEIGGNGKKRILFSVGVEDIEILHDIVVQAMAMFPRLTHPETWHRMKSMEKEMSQYLGLSKPHTPRIAGDPCPVCERKLRGQAAVAKHIRAVHPDYKGEIVDDSGLPKDRKPTSVFDVENLACIR